jgi:molecular chaperone GrpE
MVKVNINSQAKPTHLDLEHELPAGDGNETAVAEASAETSAPESELQKLIAERDSLLDRLQRTQAEFQNARRRAAKEQQDFRDYALADAIKSLLPAMDSLERALQVESSAEDLRNGVDLIHKQLLDSLAKLSVTPIEAKGEVFNPQYHEAIEMVQTDQVPDHQVVEELQRGYKFKDRLLRPAMVKVAQNPHG